MRHEEESYKHVSSIKIRFALQENTENMAESYITFIFRGNTFERALKGDVLDVDSINSCPDDIPSCVKDENIDVNQLIQFFTEEVTNVQRLESGNF